MLINLGLTELKQEKLAQAEIYLQESLGLSRQIGIPQIIANALYENGNLSLLQGQIEEAETIFREMLIIIPAGDDDLSALALYGLARTAAKQGNIHEAWKMGEESQNALKKMGHRKAVEVKIWLESITS